VDGRFNETMQNVVATTLVVMAVKFLANFGLFSHKIAYKSACMPDRPDMFWPTAGLTRGADPCCHGNDICARRGV